MPQLGIGLGSTHSITPVSTGLYEQFKTVGGDEFRTSNLKNFMVPEYSPPPSWTLGDHMGAQSIDVTININNGVQWGNDLITYGYDDGSEGFLFSNAGDLITMHRLDGSESRGLIVWDLNVKWDLDQGYAGLSAEMLLDMAHFPSNRKPWGMQWDVNGDLVVLYRRSSGEDYQFNGYDLNSGFEISGEGTKMGPNRAQSYGNLQNDGIGFSIDATAFYVSVGGGSPLPTHDIYRYNVDPSNDFMLAGAGNLNQTIDIPDTLLGQGQTRAGIFMYNGGRNLIVTGDNGNAGSIYHGIHRYSLTTPYDLTTLVHEEWIDFRSTADGGTNYRATKGDPQQFVWKPDGTRYYWGGENNYGGMKISQVTLI